MIIRRFFATFIICLGLCFRATPQATAMAPESKVVVAYGSLARFATEAGAQSHCASDIVVWLNTKTGIWHEKGMRWYGHAKQGAYVCRKEAAAAGYRDTENGQ